MSTCKLKLLDLPVEILAEILGQLDHLYILRCSAVRSVPPLSQKEPRSHLFCNFRFAGGSTPSSTPPSLSNTASNSPRMGSSTANREGPPRPPPPEWRS